MSFLQELLRWNPPPPPAAAPDVIERAYNPEWQGLVDAYLRYQGQIYSPSGYSTSIPGQAAEPVMASFVGYVQGAYKANGVVFAVSMARAMLFTDITFRWRRYGQTGGGNDLFGNADLVPLERPWPGGTTQQLLMRAEQDVTAAGTFFVARDGDGLRRLRPDWCEFILNAPPDEAIESDVIGIKYTIGGPRTGGVTRLYPVNPPAGVLKDGYAAFWSPIPDPEALYRGMSWLTPTIKEMQADQQATAHKLIYFENAATPNFTVSVNEGVTPDQFAEFVRRSREASAGIENAGKTMYLGGGATVTPVGSSLAQMDFRGVQGAGETRICAAGRVPPIIVGLSEGLSAATYSNYAQARRAFGDSWARPQWKSFAGAIAPILDVPSGAELWYDARDVAFLREDAKDLAELQSTTMATINAAIAAGWTPDSAKAAILAEDFSLLEHSGLMSVQLQPPVDPAGDAEKAQAKESGETFTAKVNDLATLAGVGGFTADSVIAAVDTRDLDALEEEQADEEPEAEIDPATGLPLEDEEPADPDADAAALAADEQEQPG